MYTSYLSLLVAFTSIVHSAAVPANNRSGPKYATLFRRNSGEATVTYATDGAQCGLGGTPPGGMTGLAVPDEAFANATHCGSCVKITSDKGSVVSMVSETKISLRCLLSDCTADTTAGHG